MRIATGQSRPTPFSGEKKHIVKTEDEIALLRARWDRLSESERADMIRQIRDRSHARTADAEEFYAPSGTFRVLRSA